MIRPDFREFQRLAKQGNLIPVYDVFPADLLTPVSAYLRIAQGARYSFLLESVEGGERIARYTFAGAHPEQVFRYNAGACVMEGPDRIVWEERDPVSFLRERMERFQPVRVPGLPPLVAGAIGYFSYDMVRLIERLPKRLRDEIGLYDAMLAFYHGLIAFDHVQHRLWIVRNVFTGGPGGTLRARYNAAVREIHRTRKLLEQPVDADMAISDPWSDDEPVDHEQGRRDRDDLPGDQFDAYLRDAKACIIPLKHDTGASGQSVMLRLMRNRKAIVATDFSIIRTTISWGSSVPAWMASSTRSVAWSRSRNSSPQAPATA